MREPPRGSLFFFRLERQQGACDDVEAPLPGGFVPQGLRASAAMVVVVIVIGFFRDGTMMMMMMTVCIILGSCLRGGDKPHDNRPGAQTKIYTVVKMEIYYGVFAG